SSRDGHGRDVGQHLALDLRHAQIRPDGDLPGIAWREIDRGRLNPDVGNSRISQLRRIGDENWVRNVGNDNVTADLLDLAANRLFCEVDLAQNNLELRAGGKRR